MYGKQSLTSPTMYYVWIASSKLDIRKYIVFVLIQRCHEAPVSAVAAK